MHSRAVSYIPPACIHAFMHSCMHAWVWNRYPSTLTLRQLCRGCVWLGPGCDSKMCCCTSGSTWFLQLLSAWLLRKQASRERHWHDGLNLVDAGLFSCAGDAWQCYPASLWQTVHLQLLLVITSFPTQFVASDELTQESGDYCRIMNQHVKRLARDRFREAAGCWPSLML